MKKAPMEHFIEEMTSELDREVTKQMMGKPISCKPKCTGCCYQLVAIGVFDAIRLTSEIMKWADWRRWAQILFDEALKMSRLDLDTEKWFLENHPCIFLENDMCKVYPFRPVACRYHFVKSPSENCLPSATNPSIMAYSCVLQATGQVMKYEKRFWDENPALGTMVVGVLPHFALHVMPWFLDPNSDADRDDLARLRGLLERLPSLHEWTVNAVNKRQELPWVR